VSCSAAAPAAVAPHRLGVRCFAAVAAPPLIRPTSLFLLVLLRSSQYPAGPRQVSTKRWAVESQPGRGPLSSSVPLLCGASCRPGGLLLHTDRPEPPRDRGPRRLPPPEDRREEGKREFQSTGPSFCWSPTAARDSSSGSRLPAPGPCSIPRRAVRAFVKTGRRAAINHAGPPCRGFFSRGPPCGRDP